MDEADIEVTFRVRFSTVGNFIPTIVDDMALSFGPYASQHVEASELEGWRHVSHLPRKGTTP